MGYCTGYNNGKGTTLSSSITGRTARAAAEEVQEYVRGFGRIIQRLETEILGDQRELQNEESKLSQIKQEIEGKRQILKDLHDILGR